MAIENAPLYAAAYYYRGYAAELMENNTQAICGHWSRPHPMPFDFRLPEPRGVHSTPTPPTNPPELVSPPENATESGWLRNIAPERDGATPVPCSADGVTPGNRVSNTR